MATRPTQVYITHLSSIIRLYEESRDGGSITDPIAHGILARAEGAIQQICGEDSPYSNRMQSVLQGSYAISYKADLIVGIVRALKGDLEDGYLSSFSELVRGEMFESFIEMAEYLLKEGYKDAAAVAGTALEAHIRQLCKKNGIALEYTASDGSQKHKRAEQLNQELGRYAYTLFDQKQITAWLDLRNNAAHGNYALYTAPQVAQLIEWLSSFMTKYPA